MGDVTRDVKKAFAKADLGDNVTYQFKGQATRMDETFSELLSALFLALILIYMLLAVLYESTITPFIRMFSLPLGLIGSILMLFLTHNTLNLFSMIGILVMDGIVAKNGTLLIDYTLTLMDRGKSPLEAVIEAGRVRLKPIFMTTITMMVGMTPGPGHDPGLRIPRLHGLGHHRRPPDLHRIHPDRHPDHLPVLRQP